MITTEQITDLISQLQELAKQAAQRAQDTTGDESYYWHGVENGLEVAIEKMQSAPQEVLTENTD